MILIVYLFVYILQSTSTVECSDFDPSNTELSYHPLILSTLSFSYSFISQLYRLSPTTLIDQ